jgi:hypothetical protein
MSPNQSTSQESQSKCHRAVLQGRVTGEAQITVTPKSLDRVTEQWPAVSQQPRVTEKSHSQITG